MSTVSQLRHRKTQHDKKYVNIVAKIIITQFTPCWKRLAYRNVYDDKVILKSINRSMVNFKIGQLMLIHHISCFKILIIFR